MKQQKSNYRKKNMGVFIAAFFVAFHHALKKDNTMQEIKDENQQQAIYFNYDQQMFIQEKKGRELITNPTFLFYTTCKNSFANFLTVFNKEYKKTENYQKKVTAQFMAFCISEYKNSKTPQTI